MNAELLAAIAQATDLENIRTELEQKIDAILTPVITDAMANMEYHELKELRDALPAGFHRSELRTYINLL